MSVMKTQWHETASGSPDAFGNAHAVLSAWRHWSSSEHHLRQTDHLRKRLHRLNVGLGQAAESARRAREALQLSRACSVLQRFLCEWRWQAADLRREREDERRMRIQACSWLPERALAKSILLLWAAEIGRSVQKEGRVSTVADERRHIRLLEVLLLRWEHAVIAGPSFASWHTEVRVADACRQTASQHMAIHLISSRGVQLAQDVVRAWRDVFLAAVSARQVARALTQARQVRVRTADRTSDATLQAFGNQFAWSLAALVAWRLVVQLERNARRMIHSISLSEKVVNLMHDQAGKSLYWKILSTWHFIASGVRLQGEAQQLAQQFATTLGSNHVEDQSRCFAWALLVVWRTHARGVRNATSTEHVIIGMQAEVERLHMLSRTVALKAALLMVGGHGAVLVLRTLLAWAQLSAEGQLLRVAEQRAAALHEELGQRFQQQVLRSVDIHELLWGCLVLQAWQSAVHCAHHEIAAAAAAESMTAAGNLQRQQSRDLKRCTQRLVLEQEFNYLQVLMAAWKQYISVIHGRAIRERMRRNTAHVAQWLIGGHNLSLVQSVLTSWCQAVSSRRQQRQVDWLREQSKRVGELKGQYAYRAASRVARSCDVLRMLLAIGAWQSLVRDVQLAEQGKNWQGQALSRLEHTVTTLAASRNAGELALKYFALWMKQALRAYKQRSVADARFWHVSAQQGWQAIIRSTFSTWSAWASAAYRCRMKQNSVTAAAATSSALRMQLCMLAWKADALETHREQATLLEHRVQHLALKVQMHAMHVAACLVSARSSNLAMKVFFAWKAAALKAQHSFAMGQSRMQVCSVVSLASDRWAALHSEELLLIVVRAWRQERTASRSQRHRAQLRLSTQGIYQRSHDIAACLVMSSILAMWFEIVRRSEQLVHRERWKAQAEHYAKRAVTALCSSDQSVALQVAFACWRLALDSCRKDLQVVRLHECFFMLHAQAQAAADQSVESRTRFHSLDLMKTILTRWHGAVSLKKAHSHAHSKIDRAICAMLRSCLGVNLQLLMAAWSERARSVKSQHFAGMLQERSRQVCCQLHLRALGLAACFLVSSTLTAWHQSVKHATHVAQVSYSKSQARQRGHVAAATWCLVNALAVMSKTLALWRKVVARAVHCGKAKRVVQQLCDRMCQTVDNDVMHVTFLAWKGDRRDKRSVEEVQNMRENVQQLHLRVSFVLEASNELGLKQSVFSAWQICLSRIQHRDMLHLYSQAENGMEHASRAISVLHRHANLQVMSSAWRDLAREAKDQRRMRALHDQGRQLCSSVQEAALRITLGLLVSSTVAAWYGVAKRMQQEVQLEHSKRHANRSAQHLAYAWHMEVQSAYVWVILVVWHRMCLRSAYELKMLHCLQHNHHLELKQAALTAWQACAVHQNQKKVHHLLSKAECGLEHASYAISVLRRDANLGVVTTAWRDVACKASNERRMHESICHLCSIMQQASLSIGAGLLARSTLAAWHHLSQRSQQVYQLKHCKQHNKHGVHQIAQAWHGEVQAACVKIVLAAWQNAYMRARCGLQALHFLEHQRGLGMEQFAFTAWTTFVAHSKRVVTRAWRDLTHSVYLESHLRALHENCQRSVLRMHEKSVRITAEMLASGLLAAWREVVQSLQQEEQLERWRRYAKHKTRHLVQLINVQSQLSHAQILLAGWQCVCMRERVAKLTSHMQEIKSKAQSDARQRLENFDEHSKTLLCDALWTWRVTTLQQQRQELQTAAKQQIAQTQIHKLRIVAFWHSCCHADLMRGAFCHWQMDAISTQLQAAVHRHLYRAQQAANLMAQSRLTCGNHLQAAVAAWRMLVLHALLLKQRCFAIWRSDKLLRSHARHKAEQSLQLTVYLQRQACCWFVLFTWHHLVQDADKRSHLEQCRMLMRERAKNAMQISLLTQDEAISYVVMRTWQMHTCGMQQEAAVAELHGQAVMFDAKARANAYQAVAHCIGGHCLVLAQKVCSAWQTQAKRKRQTFVLACQVVAQAAAGKCLVLTQQVLSSWQAWAMSKYHDFQVTHLQMQAHSAAKRTASVLQSVHEDRYLELLYTAWKYYAVTEKQQHEVAELQERKQCDQHQLAELQARKHWASMQSQTTALRLVACTLGGQSALLLQKAVAIWQTMVLGERHMRLQASSILLLWMAEAANRRKRRCATERALGMVMLELLHGLFASWKASIRQIRAESLAWEWCEIANQLNSKSRERSSKTAIEVSVRLASDLLRQVLFAWRVHCAMRQRHQCLAQVQSSFQEVAQVLLAAEERALLLGILAAWRKVQIVIFCQARLQELSRIGRAQCARVAVHFSEHQVASMAQITFAVWHASLTCSKRLQQAAQALQDAKKIASVGARREEALTSQSKRAVEQNSVLISQMVLVCWKQLLGDKQLHLSIDRWKREAETKAIEARIATSTCDRALVYTCLAFVMWQVQASEKRKTQTFKEAMQHAKMSLTSVRTEVIASIAFGGWRDVVVSTRYEQGLSCCVARMRKVHEGAFQAVTRLASTFATWSCQVAFDTWASQIHGIKHIKKLQTTIYAQSQLQARRTIATRDMACLSNRFLLWKKFVASKQRLNEMLHLCRNWQEDADRTTSRLAVLTAWRQVVFHGRWKHSRYLHLQRTESAMRLVSAMRSGWDLTLANLVWQIWLTCVLDRSIMKQSSDKAAVQLLLLVFSRWRHYSMQCLTASTMEALDSHQTKGNAQLVSFDNSLAFLQSSLLCVCLFMRWRARCSESTNIRQAAAFHAEVRVLAGGLRRYKEQMSWQCMKATISAWRGACVQRRQDDMTAMLQAQVDRISRELAIARGGRERRKSHALAIMEGSMNAAFLASALQTAALPHGAMGPVQRDENSSPNVDDF